ncbi:hypothetical protein BCR33DRAFT_752010 [Rhizoclosmatium globosum]|uniref:Uncharacterized protein n=1 Tax=Rhizoclosmatium globosum TaxID=329046 RepID=A0A1Y1ZRR5_9FUNG|nr:hypothetical protein BCR33DRAFT_752010 [Rhizoclosmatium globosum]|eukprot:ORY12485.1 hypothetical protein BCR33DRAFT_752010 [Rhizoclosmatium globosum]
MDSILLNSAAGKLFRLFTRDLLTINERAGSNPPLQRFLKTVSSPKEHPIPFTYTLFAISCEHCFQANSDILKPFPTDHEAEDANCPASCPHRCTHFRVLTAQDFVLDPLWYQARLFSPLNTSVDSYNMLLLKRLALSRVHQLSDEEAERFPNLWGIYVHGAPVALNYNFNTAAKLNNGTQCAYHSIYPQDPAALIILLDNASPTDIITIEHPWYSVVELDQNLMPQGMPSMSASKILLPIPTSSKEHSRKLDVKIAKDLNGDVKVSVVSSGFDHCSSSTYHKGQGETFDRVILDLNSNPKWTNGLTLNGLFVGSSRPHRFQDIRILPFLNRSQALAYTTNLHHDKSYIDYCKGWDSTGKFFGSGAKTTQHQLSKIARVWTATQPPAIKTPVLSTTTSTYTSLEELGNLFLTNISFESARIPRICPSSTDESAPLLPDDPMDTDDETPGCFNFCSRILRIPRQQPPPTEPAAPAPPTPIEMQPTSALQFTGDAAFMNNMPAVLTAEQQVIVERELYD